MSLCFWLDTHQKTRHQSFILFVQRSGLSFRTCHKPNMMILMSNRFEIMIYTQYSIIWLIITIILFIKKKNVTPSPANSIFVSASTLCRLNSLVRWFEVCIFYFTCRFPEKESKSIENRNSHFEQLLTNKESLISKKTSNFPLQGVDKIEGELKYSKSRQSRKLGLICSVKIKGWDEIYFVWLTNWGNRRRNSDEVTR